VAVHEIAHAYRYNLTNLWATSCNGTHSTWVTTNDRCAWEEGWADFLPTLVNNDVCYDDNSAYPPCSPSVPAANLETPSWGWGGWGSPSYGTSVEGRVAGTLLDIHDTSGSPTWAGDDGWDNADGYGLQRTWNILDPATEPNQELTLTNFWTHWNSYNLGSEPPIMGPVYQNTIAYQAQHRYVPALFRSSGFGGVTYNSSLQIQNLSPSAGAVYLRYYNQDGSLAGSSTPSVAGNSSLTINPINDVPVGFIGSLEADSDANIRIVNNLTTSAPASLFAATNALSAGSTAINLPLIMCGNSGFDTWFNVQNIGNADATVNIIYTAGGAGTSSSEGPVTIRPGAALTFNQAAGSTTRNCSNGLGGRFVGSATISNNSSNQPLVAEVMEINTTNLPLLLGYTGFASGSSTVQLPLIMANNGNFYTSIQVQNLGFINTAVTVSYSPNTGGGGNPTAEIFALAPGAAKTIIQNGVPPGNGSLNNWDSIGRYVGGAAVTNSYGQPLAVIVNQQRLSVAPFMGSAYEGFDPGQATRFASAPLIMANNSTYYTSIQVLNISAYAENVVITYGPNTGGGGNPTAEIFTLAPGSTKTIIQNGAPPGNGSLNNWNLIGRYVGSAVISADNGNVLAILNQQSFSYPGDQLGTTDAFNY
jgi:hypothetical protein